MKDIINTGAVTIRKILKDKKINVIELSKLLQAKGYNIDSQVLSNKLYRDTFTLNEYILIANVLDCEVKTISKDGNIEYIVECNAEKEMSKRNTTSEKMKELADKKKQGGTN